MQLLWQSIAQYIFRYDILVMFGCASMPGTDPQALALPLSYLYHYHLAPPALRRGRWTSVMSICDCCLKSRSISAVRLLNCRP